MIPGFSPASAILCLRLNKRYCKWGRNSGSALNQRWSR